MKGHSHFSVAIVLKACVIIYISPIKLGSVKKIMKETNGEGMGVVCGVGVVG